MTRHRWTCPRCSSGKLASSRPKKTATVRYCLPCSESTGELVERACPVLEARAGSVAAKRQRSSAARTRQKAKTKEQREATQLAKWHYGGYDLRVEAKRMVAWARSKDVPVVLPNVGVSWRLKGDYCTGHSWTGRIHLTIPKGSPASPALAVLAHEIAHECYPGHGHDFEWRLMFRVLVEELYGCEVVYEPGSNSRALHTDVIRALAAKLGETAMCTVALGEDHE